MYFHRVMWSTKCVKLYLMGDLVLCIAKSSLWFLCDSHECCNVFITSVTINYLSCIMGAKCRSARPLGSGLGKQGCPSKKWRICLMPNCSLTNTPDELLGSLTAPSSCTTCSYMPLGRDGKRQKSSSTEADGKPYPGQILRLPYLPFNWWAIRPLRRKSGTCTMRYTN